MGAAATSIIVADKDLRDLSSFRAKSVFDARRGGNGSGTRKHGADGADVVLTVPVGTQITNAEDGTLVADLREDEAAGRARARGRGRTRELELRDADAADAALRRDGDAGRGVRARAAPQADGRRRVRGAAERRQVVAPARISNAKPKVADYPFTTLAPMLGTVDGRDGRQLTVADVPGADRGRERGHRARARVPRPPRAGAAAAPRDRRLRGRRRRALAA